MTGQNLERLLGVITEKLDHLHKDFAGLRRDVREEQSHVHSRLKNIEDDMLRIKERARLRERLANFVVAVFGVSLGGVILRLIGLE